MNAIALTQELVRIRTVNPLDPERPAAERVGKLLEDAGWSVSLHEFAPGRASLVARREGASGAAPLCFAGHLDTVPLGAAAWSHDPFVSSAPHTIAALPSGIGINARPVAAAGG